MDLDTMLAILTNDGQADEDGCCATCRLLGIQVEEDGSITEESG